MDGNQKPRGGGVRLEAHWRALSWSVFDKSLQLCFGAAFLVLVVRGLPREEFGLQSLATVLQLTVTQLCRSLLLVPVVKYVAEGGEARRVAATGLVLYGLAMLAAGAVLAAGREGTAALFAKPALAAVLVPTAWLLVSTAARDATLAALEGMRRLRAVFLLDLAYYALAILGLALWRREADPRSAVGVQWVLVAAATTGSVLAVLAGRGLLLARPSRVQAARILRFGAGSFGSGAAATLLQQGDGWLAGRLMDAGGLAAYNAARQLFRGFNVVAQSVSQIVVPAASRLDAAGRRADLRVLFEKSVCFLSLAIWPLCAGLIALAPALLGLLYGQGYADSVPAFRWLVGGAGALPLATVGSAVLLGIGRLRALVWITWIGLACVLGLAAAWIPAYGPAGAAAATCVGAFLGMALRAVVLQPILGFRYRDIAARTGDVRASLSRRLRRRESAS